jgi:hypothetical protein
MKTKNPKVTHQINLTTIDGEIIYSTKLLKNFDWSSANSKSLRCLCKELTHAVKRYPKRRAMFDPLKTTRSERDAQDTNHEDHR